MPIIIIDARNKLMAVYRKLDASRFLQINVEKAKAKEGGPTYENLLKTMGRGKGANADQGKTETMPKSVESSVGTMNGFATFYDPAADKGAEHIEQLISLCRSKDADTADFYLEAVSAMKLVADRLGRELADEIKDYEQRQSRARIASRKNADGKDVPIKAQVH
jgi:hypothetical protein